MKNYFTAFGILIHLVLYSQKMNVKDYGAVGNGVNDDTPAFLAAISHAGKTFAARKMNSIVYVPAGTYLISSSLIFSKYVSLEGEFVNTTLLRMKSPGSELIILEKNRDEALIYNSYNYVRNITLQGPGFNEDPFAEKKTAASPKSTGIKVFGLRTRIQDVQVEGFRHAGIEIKGAYYTYITNCFIKNNGTGIVLDEVSTSAFISYNELRFNSIGIHSKGSSFGSFINNNMIESNMARYIEYDFTDRYEKPLSTGKGILLENTEANTVTNNYFENQFVNIAIVHANHNIIQNNFIAISNTNVNRDKNQITLQLSGNSNNNLFEKNSVLTASPELQRNKIIISSTDLSSNVVDTGIDNAKVRISLEAQVTDRKKLPKIPVNP